jgi:hypothetical protein
MAANPLKVLSDLFVKEQSVMKKGLVVSGSVSGSTGVYVKRDLIVDGDVEFGGVLTSAGHAQVGAFQVDGTFDVAGTSYLSGNVTVDGQLDVNGRLFSDELLVTDAIAQDSLTVGTNVLKVKKQAAPNSSYVYANPKLFITPSGSYSSGSAYTFQSALDLNSIDQTIMAGTEVVDVAKSLKTLDDYIFRLNQVIEF